MDDPKEQLRYILNMAFQLNKDEEGFQFWKLIYALKWQEDFYDSSASAPTRTLLIEIFNKLGYERPEAEADTVMLILDGIATMVLLKKPNDYKSVQEIILSKYQL